VADLQAASDAKSTELAKLRAAVKAYEEGGEQSPGMVQKADINALHVEVEEQRRTIAGLRAEIAANQERLARQAQHFHEEIRRMGTQRTDEPQDGGTGSRKSLAERISAPRQVQSPDHEAVGSDNAAAAVPRDVRPPYLRALNGNDAGGNADTGASNAAPATSTSNGDRPPPLPATDGENKVAGALNTPPPRRPRLLERISGLDKR
jgi:hypothetical protein